MSSFWDLNGGIYLAFPMKTSEGKPPPLTKPLRYTEDRHVVTVAPNRTGKTMRLLLPNLVELTNWSMVVNDIRGDLSEMTEEHRRKAGNLIVKLKPFGKGSDGFNPVQALEVGDEFPDDALQIAEAIIRVEGKEPHFAQAAQELVAALIMYVRLVIPDGSLADVRALLGLPDKRMMSLVRGGGDVDPRQLNLFHKDPASAAEGYAPPFLYKKKLYPGIVAAAEIYDWPEMAVKAERFGDITPRTKKCIR